jgi:hypothetical protein
MTALENWVLDKMASSLGVSNENGRDDSIAPSSCGMSPNPGNLRMLSCGK